MILSEGELVRWGNRIGRDISGPVFLGLKGPLGAGKSVLARAVARGAGVEGPIPSPTFNLVFRYPTPRGVPLVHMDLYRIEDSGELWELGWEELGTAGELVVVEWPERAGQLLPHDRLAEPSRGTFSFGRKDRFRVRPSFLAPPSPAGRPRLPGGLRRHRAWL